jgi:TrmH family RNA methyltransferase
VTSAAAALRRLAQLASDPSYVRLDGVHAVKHALRFGAALEVAVAADRAATLAVTDAVAPDVVDRLAASVVQVSLEDLRAVDASYGRRDADVVALVRRPALAEVGDGPVVLLEEPRHLGNVGAVIRLAAGFGARGVRTTGSVDPWHPTVVRGAAGLHLAVPVRRVALEEAVEPEDGPLVVLDPAGRDLRRTAVPERAVLAFGTERHGISPALRARADEVLAIPIRAGVSSYNLASAVAITLYHASLGLPLR